MGVFKEHAHAFEDVAKKQSRIFNDACDYGYAYNTNNVPEDIKLLIHYVDDLKGSELLRSREEWDHGVTVVIRIGWEIDEGDECGTQYTISFNYFGWRYEKSPDFLHKGCNAYISVDVESYREPRTFKNGIIDPKTGKIEFIESPLPKR